MDWNQITKHPLRFFIVLAALVIAYYYWASPYQNCVRNTKAGKFECGQLHRW